MNDTKMKPVLNFQRLLMFLIVALMTSGHVFAIPLWQSPVKKTVTPDPYFNPRSNGKDFESKATELKTVSPAPQNHSPEGAKQIPANSGFDAPNTALNGPLAKTAPTQPVWQPPRTPVAVAKTNATKKIASSPTKSPLVPAAASKSASFVAKTPNSAAKTIIREKRNNPAGQVVSNDFAAAIISKPPTAGRYPLTPAKSPSTNANKETPAPGKLESTRANQTKPPQKLAKNPEPTGNSMFLDQANKLAESEGFKSSDTATTKVSTASTSKKIAAPANVETFEPTRLLAMVGGEPIFVGDVLFEVNQMIEKFMGNAPESLKKSERKKIVTKILPKFIDSKMLYLGTLDMLPEGADVETILDQAGKEFDEKAMPRMMESAGLKTANEFDAQLRAQGSSLRKMRLAWSKDQLTKYFLSQQLDADSEVTHQEMLDNYRGRIDEYAISAKSKWEQIMIRFDRAGSRADAKKQIAELANQIVYGANLAAIAKKNSHGFRAAEGGQHDWTSKGALVLKELDKAIFELPIGELSDVIESKDGFHIVRVLERTESTHKPFLEAQVDIKKQLLEERRNAAFKKHLEKLRDRIPVEYFDLNGQNFPLTAAAKSSSGPHR